MPLHIIFQLFFTLRSTLNYDLFRADTRSAPTYLPTYPLIYEIRLTIHEIRIWLLSSSLYTTYDIRNTLFYIGYFPSKQAKHKLSPGILSKTLHSPSILIWPKLSAPNHSLVSSKLWLAAHKSFLLGVSIP